MNKYMTVFESIMDTRDYKVLHRSLQRQPDQMFGITDWELDDIIKYDVLRIMISYCNVMNISQKKCVVDLLESKMEFRNISLLLDTPSDSVKDKIYIPYLLKLINRLDTHPVFKAAYHTLFMYCTSLISPRINHVLHAYDYLALMNIAYFSVLADGLRISDSYTQYMKARYGYSSYDDFVDHLYERYADDADWDLEIDLDGIDKFLEDNAKDRLFVKKILEEDTVEFVGRYFDIINIVADLRGEDIIQTRVKQNDSVLTSVLHETGIHIIKRIVICGFDCCFCNSEDYSEDYVIIQRHSSYYRMLTHDDNSLKILMEEIDSAAIELNLGIPGIYIIFIIDKTESGFSEEVLKSDSEVYPRYAFSKEDAISFLQGIVQRYFKDDDGYRLYIEDNRWILNNTIYVPYLKIATVKYGIENDFNINIKVVFYESEKKKLWAEDEDYDTNSEEWKFFGLIRICTFLSNHGYENKISTHSMPDIYAEIYVNDEFYGQVSINCSYEQSQEETLVFKSSGRAIKEPYSRKTQKPFFPIVTAKYWKKSEELFVPSLMIDVINQKSEPADFIFIQAVFYDMKARNLWSASTSFLVLSGNTPLKQGYRKTAFLKASVGYENQIDKDTLPEITAEIYINGGFYGTTTIDTDYEYNEYDKPLNENPVTVDNDYVRVNSQDFRPVIKQNKWGKNSNIYSPFLQLDIINQQEVPANQLDIDVHFYHTSQSESWGHYTDSILPTSILLRPGFNISAFVKCPTGYEGMLKAEDLPDIAASVYINSIYYGNVMINRSYNNKSLSEPLTVYETDEDRHRDETNKWNEKSFLGAMGYSTNKPENERHVILFRAVKEYGKQRIVNHISFLVNMRIVQENGVEKYKRAIKIWKEDLVYVRNI